MAWYPWYPQEIKELKKAVAEDGPNSPWAETNLEGRVHHMCITQDWKDLANGFLSGPVYLKWTAYFQEECWVQGEWNQSAQPPIPITAGMLAGTADRYCTGIQQEAIPYQDQVQALGLAAWKNLSEGPAKSPISGINQKVIVDLPFFIDIIHKSLKRKVPPLQRSEVAFSDRWSGTDEHQS